MTVHHDDDPLAALSAAGVSIWLDDLSREPLAGGELESLIADKHVVGITTNPTIFASALAHGDRYTPQLRALAETRTSVEDAVFAITTDDEVDPGLAGDAVATVDRARALWTVVGEPNMFVKIPATVEGLAAIATTRRRRHQCQRDTDLLPRPLPRCDRRLPHRSGTMPYSTLDAFVEHGSVVGETQGITKFVDSWRELGRTVSHELHNSVR